MFSGLSFQHPFRKYQRMILSRIESDENRKHHVVAPPGSGKTIVGLELIRRFGHPAVVFAPTTTIQRQWYEKLGMFTTKSAEAETLTSLDPKQLAPVNIFTYQLISTPSESGKKVREMALQDWEENLVGEGQSENETAARERIETLRENNPRAFNREISRHYKRLKHKLMQEEGADIAHFLHPNAQELVQRLVDHGVRTVVLDECHHLLDYWAIVLRHLISRLTEPRVIGLTATLPSPEDDHEYENYTALLGDVDFEVPTPALVKEGSLAPYRDLAYFVEPSPREIKYLKDLQGAFEEAITELSAAPRFRDWVWELIQEHSERWEAFLRQRPFFSLAAHRFLKRIDRPISPELPLPVETEKSMEFDDWMALLERYGLDHLKMSSAPEDHRQLKRLRKVFHSFGFTLTERGLRQSRAPGGLVLAFSESKDRGVAQILVEEARHLGELLRAVVVTDFERMSSGVTRLKGVLERDAGSALRLFRYLVNHAGAGKLDPILVTGRTLLVDADHGLELLDDFNAYLRGRGLKAICRYREAEHPQVFEVVGEGPDWSSRTYVGMVTSVFEKGTTRCLVGTRGIFGEGWDALSLNTLIDLTSVTTSTSVQQLRGRTIRKDPTWPRKVAHNWDVICVANMFQRGDKDLQRFIRRHDQYWGIQIIPRRKQLLMDIQTSPEGGLLPALTGDPFLAPEPSQIVKGVSHVDYKLAFELAVKKFKKIKFNRYSNKMLNRIKERENVYDYWGVGNEYSNFTYSATRLETKDLRIRTVYSMNNTLKRMLRQFRASVSLGLFTSITMALYISTLEENVSASDFLKTASYVFGACTLIAAILNTRSAYRLGRAFLVEQPPDAILLDVGRALLATMKEAQLVSTNLQADFVRVIEQPDNSYEVLLDYASPEDAATFIEAYRQIFEDVRKQRYLILRDDSRLPSLGLSSFWYMIRRWFRNTKGYKPAYHPVPKMLAKRRKLAETFARHWEKYVGGSSLVYTRTGEGRKILLEARAQHRPRAANLAFEIWR